MSRRPGEFTIFRTIIEFQAYVAAAAANQNPLAVAGDMPDADGDEPTAYSYEQNIGIGAILIQGNLKFC